MNPAGCQRKQTIFLVIIHAGDSISNEGIWGVYINALGTVTASFRSYDKNKLQPSEWSSSFLAVH